MSRYTCGKADVTILIVGADGNAREVIGYLERAGLRVQEGNNPATVIVDAVSPEDLARMLSMDYASLERRVEAHSLRERDYIEPSWQKPLQLPGKGPRDKWGKLK